MSITPPPRTRPVELHNRFEIVRVRNFLNHDHGQVTKVDAEITIHSTGKTKHMILSSAVFLPKLRMADASGEEYPLMTNKHLRAMLNKVKPSDPDRPEADRLLAGINGKKIHLLWFKIPPHKVLRPREARVLHMTYERPKEEGGIMDTIQSLRMRTITIDIPPEQPFPVFWILNKPIDYNISRRRYLQISDGKRVEMGSWKENADTVVSSSAAKSISLHIKPGPNGAALSYALTPKKIKYALPVSAVAMLSLLAVSLGVSPLLDGAGPLQPIADAIILYEMPLLLFIIASSLAIPRFVDDAHLRNGLFWLYFVPVGLALGSFVL